jgi:hypothetical protein
MKTLCLTIFAVVVLSTSLHAQQFNQSFTHDGVSPVKGLGYDRDGNLYTAASMGYAGNGVVYPGPDNSQAFNLGDRGFIITRHSTDGSLDWIRGLTKGANNHNQGLILEDMTVTADGDLFLTGWFKNEVDFDPGTGQELRQAETTQGANNTDNDNAFLLKLDNNGEFQWVRTWRGYGAMGRRVVVSPNGNIHVMGVSMGSDIDLDPGTSSEVVINTYFALFMGWIVTLDSAGDFQWGHAYSVDAGTAQPLAESVALSGLATDSQGNVFMCGMLRTTYGGGEMRILTEGTPHPGFSAVGAANILLMSYDEAGTRRWVQVRGVSPDGLGNQAWAVTVDDDDDVYFTGNYSGQVDFDPPNNQTTTGNGDNGGVFLLKVDNDGNFLWVREFISDYSNAFAQCIEADGTGVIIAGGFGSVMDFDPGVGQQLHDAADGNGFMLKLDRDGDYLWSRSFGTDYFSGGGFGSDPLPQTGGRWMAKWNHRIALGGHFRETADFNPGGTGGVHHSPGAPTAFVMIMDQPSLLPPLTIHHDALPSTLPQGGSVDLRLWADGGTFAGYEWSISSGGLPPGFSLQNSSDSNEARIIGTIQQEGTWDFTLRVTDDIGNYTDLPINWQLAFEQSPPGNGGNGNGNGGNGDTGNGGGTGNGLTAGTGGGNGGCTQSGSSGVWALLIFAAVLIAGRRRLVPKHL